MASVSFDVASATKKHPMEKAARLIVDAQASLQQDRKAIYEKARSAGWKKTPTTVDAEKVLAFAKENGIHQRLVALFTAIKAEREAAQAALEMERVQPPRAKELYERVEKGSEIVDIGCGDARRLLQVEGRFEKITGVEKEAIEPKQPMAELEIVVEPISAIPEEALCTSFNVYNQLESSEKKEVDAREGIHIAPLQSAFSEKGLTKKIGSKVHVTVGEKVFVESPTPQPVGSIVLNESYVGFDTFKKRDVILTATKKVKGIKVVQEYARSVDVHLGTRTWKEDGTALFLKINAGKFTLVQRNGLGVGGEAPRGLTGHLHLEQTTRGLVLLRVQSWQNRRPFHSLQGMVKFLAKVKIKIDGQEIIRRRMAVGEPPDGVDGVVVIDGEQDFVYNFHTHFDIALKHKEKFEDFIKARYPNVNWEGKAGSLSEVILKVDDAGEATCVWKERGDKSGFDRPDMWTGKLMLMKAGDLDEPDFLDDDAGFDFDDDDAGVSDYE